MRGGRLGWRGKVLGPFNNFDLLVLACTKTCLSLQVHIVMPCVLVM